MFLWWIHFGNRLGKRVGGLGGKLFSDEIMLGSIWAHVGGPDCGG